MADIVRIAVPVPLPGPFDYAVPAELGVPPVGGRVHVPFGRRTLVGVCVATNPENPHPDPKPILSSFDRQPALPADLLELAHWLSDYYLHPLGEVCAALLPTLARRGAELTIAYPEAWQLTSATSNLARAPRQQQLFAELEQRGGRASTDTLYSLGFPRNIIKSLAAKGIIKRINAAQAEPSVALERPPQPNSEQQRVLTALQDQGPGFQPSLLEGVTGSGKTEVYLRRIAGTYAAGRQALVLVPEIALTPQTLARFERRFGHGAVASLHSGLSDRERLQAWLKCRNGEAKVIVGTRSAVLAPFKDLALIVVDEEHDGSFKQTDGLRYNARDVAVKRAQQLAIPLLLGSATPALETLHNAGRGRYAHLQLTQRAGNAKPPSFALLDLRGQTLTHGLSNDLIRTIGEHVAHGNQALIFLNRRGFAPTYLCASCGWQASCTRCELPMTLHRTPPTLICHHCAERQAIPTACGACGAPQLVAVGVGTQRTEAGLTELFPDIPVIRVDRDTTRSQAQLTERLEDIGKGEPALLLGTQMLAKGHHFPRVTLVGVINADGGFLSPDFRAPERTAQLITQVAGRAGRAERPGTVLIQTYQPDNPLLRSLIEEGYGGFAARELLTREAAALPPFRPMALIRAESPNVADAMRLLGTLSDELRNASAERPPAAHGQLEVLGPVPAPIPRIANRYRGQLLVMATGRGLLHNALAPLRELTLPKDRNLRWSIDIDPYDAF